MKICNECTGGEMVFVSSIHDIEDGSMYDLYQCDTCVNVEFEDWITDNGPTSVTKEEE